jgi:M6 family metalloprotease-like protein
MLTVSLRRLTILSLLFLALFLLPNAVTDVLAKPQHPQVLYEPSSGNWTSPTPSMPLPAPSFGPYVQPAPTSGVLRLLIIAARFPNVPNTTSITAIRASYFQQVAAYYREDSLGKVTLTGDVFGWYTLPYPEAHYGRNCLAINDAACDGSDASWQIAQDVIPLVEKDPTANVNFMNYDYYIFVHSGYGQESSGGKDDIWSVTYLGGVWVETNSRTLTKFNVVPELEADGAVPIGVYCHEFGHNLGLPDLYNTNTGKTILGPWSLMDKGLWNGDPSGSSPSHMDAWSKIQLGFISGSMLATASNEVTSIFTIDPIEVATNNVHAVEVPLQANNPSQYYLIEVRSPTGFDQALPTWGVLVLYVDMTLTIGKVKIVNANPTVQDLTQATWTVGQTFTDSKNGWSMTVDGKTGNSYQVTVNRGGSQPPIQPPIQNNQTYVDLAITSISAQPSVITVPNTNVTITAQISNLGTQNVSNVPVEVDLDGSLYKNTQVSVDTGTTTLDSFTWISVLGAHTFKVAIDPEHTINNTNKVNNVATFTLSVGPTLTINLPINLTSAQNVWVAINGARYNITSNQFQASVPTGTITVEIQPEVNTSQGVRQHFVSWSDGNQSNPRQVSVVSNVVLGTLYTTQYLLFVNENGGTTTPSGWYYVNSTATIYANDPSNVTANSSRLTFSSWTGDVNSTSTSLTIQMHKPMSIQANWIKQYYVTIISPTTSSTGEGWYNVGTTVIVSVQSTVLYGNGTRLIFSGWNSNNYGNNPTTQIVVDSPTRLIAGWNTQYLVSVQSAYGKTSGSGWYDTDAVVPVSVQKEVDYANATRRIFVGWSGDYTGSSNNATIQIDSSKALTARWVTQYLVTFTVTGIPNSTVVKLNLDNATYNLSTRYSYRGWYSQGSTVNPILNQTVVDGVMVYKFTGWRNSTGGLSQAPLSVNAPSNYVASYASAFTLPAIPGFPIEAIVLGILFGSLTLALNPRRRSRKSLQPSSR